MARSPRLSLPSYPHHVIQRGNNRQPIFLALKDYEVFLDCLREAKRKCHARLYASSHHQPSISHGAGTRRRFGTFHAERWGVVCPVHQ